MKILEVLTAQMLNFLFNTVSEASKIILTLERPRNFGRFTHLKIFEFRSQKPQDQNNNPYLKIFFGKKMKKNGTKKPNKGQKMAKNKKFKILIDSSL